MSKEQQPELLSEAEEILAHWEAKLGIEKQSHWGIKYRRQMIERKIKAHYYRTGENLN